MKQNNEILIKIGSRIRELRLNRKLTLRQLSNKINVNFTTIGTWETGLRQPRIEHLQRVCSFFGVTVEELWK